MAAPLDGLHVLELAGGIAAPYAGRLLALLGATVVKVEPDGGDPARTKQVDDTPLARSNGYTSTSPLYWHLNAGKRNVASGNLSLAWADVVLTDRVRRQVEDTPLDPSNLLGAPLLVTVTAFGYDADDPGTIDDEVLAQARSGILGRTGNPGTVPIRLPGWPAQYLAGAGGAVAALAGLRLPGTRHIDVSWTASMMVAMELHYADALACGRRRAPVGPFPRTAFPAGALPCQDGFVTPGTFRDIDWELQALFYGMPELAEDERFRTRGGRAEYVEEIWARIQPWYAKHSKRQIFQYCLDTPWAVGMVLDGRDALSDEHLAERGLLGHLETEEGAVLAPVQPWRTDGIPVADQRVRVTGEDTAWAQRVAPLRANPITRKPLQGLRMIEVTVAWAGPFVGNMLGALGMDVIRLEATRPFEGYRVLRLNPDADPDHLKYLREQDDPRYFDVSPLFNAVNRNKRICTLDLGRDEGREVFLDLVRDADVVISNFRTKVLPDLRIGYDDLVKVNPGIIVLRMPAFGTTGPYKDAAGYGPIVEGMGGLGARFGYDDEGARISDLYFPDPIAGTHAALAVLSAIEQRERTGRGSDIDFSHMDVTWFTGAESIITAARDGRVLGRMGNREPGVACSGIVATRDERFVAYVGSSALEPIVAAAATTDAAELVGAVERNGGKAMIVNDAIDGMADPALADRFEVVDHPVCGPTGQLRSVFTLDGRPTTTQRHAPIFDQHTDEVMTEIGYRPERIIALREDKVIGGTMPRPSQLGR